MATTTNIAIDDDGCTIARCGDAILQSGEECDYTMPSGSDEVVNEA